MRISSMSGKAGRKGKMEKRQRRKTGEYAFLLALAVFALADCVRFFQHEISEYNTTLFAMSYRYGFISRGMLGTIWAGLDALLPVSLMNYEAVYWFSVIMTVLWLVMLFVFFGICLSRCRMEHRRNLQYLIALLGIFAFPMMLTDEVFGRLDIYLYICILLMCILLITERAQWLVAPLCVFCMCIHQGFIFTNFNVVLLLLLYRVLMSTKTARKRYGLLLAVTLALVGGLFLYFEFFSHADGEAIYEEVVSAAKALSYDGKHYNASIINHEILGKDVFEDEWEMHLLNYQEFPCFLALFLPYIIIAVFFFTHLLKGEQKEGGRRGMLGAWVQALKEDRPLPQLTYLLYLLGGAAVLPQMLLKVDYGRYIFMTFFYYLAAAMGMMAMKDSGVADQLEATKTAVKERTPFPLALLIYPIFFMPLFDVVTSGAVHKVSTWVFWWLQ